ARFAPRHLPEEHRVHEAEDRRRDPHPERERHHRGGEEAWGARERTDGEAEVAGDRLHTGSFDGGGGAPGSERVVRAHEARRTTASGRAPSAIRIPISCPRRATEWLITP